MHRYNLEPYKSSSSRHRCPGCNKNKTFSLYLDALTSGPVNYRVGRCNREVECAYNYTPSQYFKDNGLNIEHIPYFPLPPKQQPPTSYIDPEIFKKSLAAYGSNNFIKFLLTIFDDTTVNKLISKYFIGTSFYWTGSTVFWQVDYDGRIRTGKVMLYDSITGKRVKEPFSHLTWSHKVLNLQDFNHKLCLFGEHLLKIDQLKPVAVVESEKTAMIASVYLPQYIWVAVGGLSQLTAERCKYLKGRNVTLYPDLNAYNKWLLKGIEFGFKTSAILESKATDEEKSKGLDVADFLLRVNTTEIANKSGDLTNYNTKNDHILAKSKSESHAPFKVQTKNDCRTQIIELREYFENLDRCGFILKENANIPGLGLRTDLRANVGEVWQSAKFAFASGNLEEHIRQLRLIKDYYSSFDRTPKVTNDLGGYFK